MLLFSTKWISLKKKVWTMAEYIYNTSVINDYAKKLRVWADNPENFVLLEFLCENGLCHDKLSVFAKKNDNFYEALRYAKMKIATKLHKKVAKNEINQSFYHRIIRLYDCALEKKEDEDKELDYKLKAKYDNKDNSSSITVNVTDYKNAETKKKKKDV